MIFTQHTEKLSGEPDTFVGIIYATRNLDELLGIQAKDIECKCPMVRPIDVRHSSRRIYRAEKITSAFQNIVHDRIRLIARSKHKRMARSPRQSGKLMKFQMKMCALALPGGIEPPFQP
jgi:hypothetical protein